MYSMYTACTNCCPYVHSKGGRFAGRGGRSRPFSRPPPPRVAPVTRAPDGPQGVGWGVGGLGVQGTPTYTPQNDHRDALIILR